MTDIIFLKGIEHPPMLPKQLATFVQKAGLNYRFAVIQDTYVESRQDMYFDEQLWKRLIEFIVAFDIRVTVTVTERGKRPEECEVSLKIFLDHFRQLSDGDRRPPAIVVARKEDRIELCMITEYWRDVGGPRPYADSYTYSIFSNRDLSEEIPSFISMAPDTSQWKIAKEILLA